MELEKGRISGNQLIFFVGIFMQASLFTATFSFSSVYRNVWLLSITAYLIYLIFALIYLRLMNSFPGKSIILINDIVFGKQFGKIMSAGYLLYFITLTAANIRFISVYMVGTFMTHTPIMSFALLYVLICILAVRSGIEPVARLGFLLVVIVSASLIITYSFAANKIDFHNFMPIMDITTEDFIQVNHSFLSIYFGETVVFLMIAPLVSDQTKLKKSFLLGSLIGLATLLFTVIVVTGVLGKIALISRNPLIETSQQIELKNIIPRIEIIIMGAILFSLFMKNTATFYASTLGLSQILNLRSYQILAIPLGLFILGLSALMHKDVIEQVESGAFFWPFYASISILLLPTITLITAAFRGFVHSEEGGNT